MDAVPIMNDELDYSIHYQRWHDGSDADYSNSADFYGRVLAPVLSILPTCSRILDVGCGTGLLVNALLRRGYSSVEGVDISSQQIQAARARGLPCKLVSSDWLEDHSQVANGEYDTVFLLDVLEHVPVAGQVQLLRSVWRLLSDDGIAVLTVPNSSSSFSSRMRYIDWTHTSAFTEASLEFVASNAGFSSAKFYSCEYVSRPPFPFLPRGASIRWALWLAVRACRRLSAYAEFGGEGWSIPLGPNLLAVLKKKPHG